MEDGKKESKRRRREEGRREAACFHSRAIPDQQTRYSGPRHMGFLTPSQVCLTNTGVYVIPCKPCKALLAPSDDFDMSRIRF